MNIMIFAIAGAVILILVIMFLVINGRRTKENGVAEVDERLDDSKYEDRASTVVERDRREIHDPLDPAKAASGDAEVQLNGLPPEMSSGYRQVSGEPQDPQAALLCAVQQAARELDYMDSGAEKMTAVMARAERIMHAQGWRKIDSPTL